MAIVLSSCKGNTNKESDSMKQWPVRGWNILTSDLEQGLETIEASKNYDINHLQISHQVIMDLKDVRIPQRLENAKRLISAAQEVGIDEITVWDHALYDLEYYPQRFRTGPDSTLNLDNPEFWEWFKNDYREMLTMIPGINGIILTFIETGARSEDQYSEENLDASAKLARVINNLADVVAGEYNMSLYLRTFAYTPDEYEVITGCFDHLRHDELKIMIKETPHDFFLTHPNNPLAGTIDMPTIIEFDCGNEYNGQGIILNTWPDHILARARDLLNRPNVIGYVARTDRYGKTGVVNQPAEIQLTALNAYVNDTTTTGNDVYQQFISNKYGPELIELIQPIFERSKDIITSSLYTLGTNMSNHSQLNYDPYPSSYSRHVSGRWMQEPVVNVKHDVNRQFHYWKDVVNHLAPPPFKEQGTLLDREADFAIDNGWVEPVENMNPEYLRYVITEKEFSYEAAEQALNEWKALKSTLSSDQFEQGYHILSRTMMTSKLYLAVVKSYFGYRTYLKHSDPEVKEIVQSGLSEIEMVTAEMEDYPFPGPTGQWSWLDDIEMARTYYQKITQGNWAAYDNLKIPAKNIQTK